jgi:hypothetical protein
LDNRSDRKTKYIPQDKSLDNRSDRRTWNLPAWNKGSHHNQEIEVGAGVGIEEVEKEGAGNDVEKTKGNKQWEPVDIAGRYQSFTRMLQCGCGRTFVFGDHIIVML